MLLYRATSIVNRYEEAQLAKDSVTTAALLNRETRRFDWLPAYFRFGGGWEGKEGETFSTFSTRGLPVACFVKLPGVLYPPTSNFRTRKLRQGRHQCREKLLHLQVLPQLCNRFSSLPPLHHVGARRDSGNTLSRSTVASRVQPTCRLSTHEPGPPRGDASTVRSAGVQTTLAPSSPHRRRAREGSREGGGAGARRKGRWGRAWRAAPGDHDPWLATTPGWPRPQASVATGHCREDLQSAQHAGSQRLSHSGTSVSR